MSATERPGQPLEPMQHRKPSRPARPPVEVRTPRSRVGGAVRSEWVKFGSLLSHLLTTAAVAGVIAGFGAMLVWVGSEDRRGPGVAELLSGVSWAQLLIGLLGAVFACAEWSSGTAQPTFLATPRRWRVLLGKALVIGSVSGVAGVIGASGALFAGAVGGVPVGVEPGLAVRMVLGAGGYLAGIGVLAVAIGVIVRNLVGGILAVVGFLWVLPLLGGFAPWATIQRLLTYLPAPAGGTLLAADDPNLALTPSAGGAVLCAWAIGAALASVAVLHARDV